MEKPNDIYIILYTSPEDFTRFAEGDDTQLALYPSHLKGAKDTVELSLPVKWLYRENSPYYYIEREDFADQF